MKASKLKKSQFSSSSLNWEKFRSTVLANTQKLQFSISSMNWEELRKPARATFKNLNFQSLFEL